MKKQKKKFIVAVTSLALIFEAGFYLHSRFPKLGFRSLAQTDEQADAQITPEVPQNGLVEDTAKLIELPEFLQSAIQQAVHEKKYAPEELYEAVKKSALEKGKKIKTSFVIGSSSAQRGSFFGAVGVINTMDIRVLTRIEEENGDSYTVSISTVPNLQIEKDAPLPEDFNQDHENSLEISFFDAKSKTHRMFDLAGIPSKALAFLQNGDSCSGCHGGDKTNFKHVMDPLSADFILSQSSAGVSFLKSYFEELQKNCADNLGHAKSSDEVPEKGDEEEPASTCSDTQLSELSKLSKVFGSQNPTDSPDSANKNSNLENFDLKTFVQSVAKESFERYVGLALKSTDHGLKFLPALASAMLGCKESDAFELLRTNKEVAKNIQEQTATEAWTKYRKEYELAKNREAILKSSGQLYNGKEKYIGDSALSYYAQLRREAGLTCAVVRTADSKLRDEDLKGLGFEDEEISNCAATITTFFDLDGLNTAARLIMVLNSPLGKKNLSAFHLGLTVANAKNSEKSLPFVFAGENLKTAQKIFTSAALSALSGETPLNVADIHLDSEKDIQEICGKLNLKSEN